MKYSESYTYQKMANELRERLHGRPYSIGLDLGVGSIGVAAVALEPDAKGKLYPTELVYANSRMFKSSEGASDRRKARGQRNSLRHKANRLKKTWKILAERGLMLAYSEKQVDNSATLRFSEDVLRKSPYDIRYKGLHEELSLEELGYALYHIANHRGSASIRSFLDVEKTADDKKAEEQMRLTESLVADSGAKTFIEVLWVFNKDEFKGFRNTLTNGVPHDAPLPTRDIIENEVELLLSEQQKYHKELSEDYIARIKETIFFENEKFVPEPGHCPYFPEETKLPVASFLNEERRLWESLINVRIIRKHYHNGITRRTKMGLGAEELQKLFEALRSGKDLSPAGIKKILPQYKADEVVVPGSQKSPKIKGFRFHTLEEKAYWKRLDSNQQDRFIALYVNTPDDKALRRYYKTELGLSDAEVDDVLKSVSLVGGYTPVGKTAMGIILERIIAERETYGEAESSCIIEGQLVDVNSKKMYDRLPYYGEAISTCTQNLAGKSWHSLFKEKVGKPGFIKPNTNAEEELYGRIANPVVHQTLNELRKLLNEVMDIFGEKPTEITVELARELKVGKEKREEISKNNAEKEKRNTELFKKYCLPNSLSKKYVKKFRIWEDQGCRCPYCLKQISVVEIVNGSCDYEHILPEEDTGDSSELNLVIAHGSCNGTKSKRIPFAAFGGDSVFWSKIEENLDSTEGMKLRKKKFLMTEEDYEEYLDKRGFMSRFASDNAYIARVACEYLRSLYPVEEKYKERYVKTIKGSETAFLRSAWNLNGITASLGVMHAPELADSLDEDRKSREDIRHHALDAIVAAYFTYSTKQLIETESGKNTDQSVMKKRIPIPKNFRKNQSLSTTEEKNDFRQYIDDFIVNKTYGSWKVDTNKNGQLTEDTQYSILIENGVNCVLVTKKKISSMNVKTVFGKKSGSVEYALTGYSPQKWVDAEGMVKIEKCLSLNEQKFKDIQSQMKQAKQQMEEENAVRKSSGKAELTISETSVLKRALASVGGVYYSLSNNTLDKLTPKRDLNGDIVSAFTTGSNYSFDFYFDDDGKLGCESIRKVDVMRKDYRPKYQKEGRKLAERLFGREILEVDSSLVGPNSDMGEQKRSIKTPNAPEGRTFIIVTMANVVTEKTFQIKYDSMLHSKPQREGSISMSALPNLNLRKVTISPAGLVVYRSPFIKNKDVESN